MREGTKKLPKGWKWVKLGELGELSQGGTPSTSIPDYWNGEIPFITGADINGLYVSKARSFLSEYGYSSGKTAKCQAGDLLVVSRTRVGRVGISASKLGISQDVSVIRLDEGMNSKYIALFLISISQHLEKACQGSTIQGLTRDYLENILTPIPPTIQDQNNLADEIEIKLNNINKMLNAAKRQKEASYAMQGAVLREMFPYKEGDKLPEGWKWDQLHNLAVINPQIPKGFKRSGEALTSFIPMSSVDDVTGTVTKLIDRPYEQVSNGYTFFEEGDILFAKITPCMENGKVAIVNNLRDGIGFGSTEFHVIRSKDSIACEWIYLFLRNPTFRRKAELNFEGSAGQKRVPSDFMQKSLVPFPKIKKDQEKIIKNTEDQFKDIYNMRIECDKQLEAISAMQGAILREYFDFEDYTAN